MNLTDLANARSGFSQEMNNLLTLVAGSHTPEQRTAQIDTTTAECFTLCKTAKAVRVANPNAINTQDFYSRADLPFCSVLDSFHTKLGGTHMYEMFCNRKYPRDPAIDPSPACELPVIEPTFPEGPMVMTYTAGMNVDTCLYGFAGTIEYQDGYVEHYNTPTNLLTMDLPDDGNGYCTLMLRGILCVKGGWNDMIWFHQFGTECVVGNWWSFFAHQKKGRECIRITPADQPRFGDTEYGVYGTRIDSMFRDGANINDSVDHWDMTGVTQYWHTFWGTTYVGTKDGYNNPTAWDLSGAVHATDLDQDVAERDNPSIVYGRQPQWLLDKWNITL